MRKSFLLCLLLALCSAGATRALAAADPGERFLDAYFLIQDGDAAEAQSDWATANTKYTGALAILGEIKAQAPDWNPHIIEFRSNYCHEHLDALKPKLPAAAPAPPAAAAVPPPAAAAVPLPATVPAAPVAETPTPAPAAPAEGVAAPAGNDRIQQLTSELQQSQDKIRQIQQDRDALKAQLDAQLNQPAPADRAEAQKALEQLHALEAVRDALTARLQDAEAKAVQVETLQAQLQQSQEKVKQLEASQAALNVKLQEALSQTAATQTSPQIEDLLKKNADLTTQLAAAKNEIAALHENPGTAAPAGADQVKLRADLTRTRRELDKAKHTLDKTSQQLAAERKEVDALRAENARLKETDEEVTDKLTESERQLRSARLANQKNSQIIIELRKENKHLTTELKDARAHPESAAAAETQTPAPPATAQPPSSVSSIKETGSGQLAASFSAPPQPPEPPPAAPSPHPAAAPGTQDLLNEARAAAALKDYDTAASRYEQVLTREPGNVTALSKLGAIRFQQGKLDEAEQLLNKAVTAAPNDSESRSLLGIVYFRTGKLDDAFDELTRAVALDPRNAEAHNYLGITLNEKGWGAAAEEEMRRAIEIDPQYADAHFNLAVMYAKQKTPRLELARYHYQKAIDLGAARDPQLETLLKASDQPPASP
jgi:Flp pilus assembly protein TadD